MTDLPPLRLAMPADPAIDRPPPSTPPIGVGRARTDAGDDRRITGDPSMGDPPTGEMLGRGPTLHSTEVFGLTFEDVGRNDSPDRTGATPSRALHDDEPEDGSEEITGRRVRPYTITGGRTSVVGAEIPLEAQVLTSNQGPVDPSRYRWETARLVQMLEAPMALIEIAARLQVPVGVARVLVSDLVAEGVLIVHLPPPSSSFTSLLEQVLDGVRRL